MAPRQCGGGMEAVTFVASVKYRPVHFFFFNCKINLFLNPVLAHLDKLVTMHTEQQFT